MIGEVAAFVAAVAATLAAVEVVRRPVRRSGRGFASLAVLGRAIAPGAAPLAELDRRLVEAGRPGAMSARDLLGAKLGAAAAAATGGLVAGAALPGRLGVLAAVVAPAAGFVAPDVWLARRRRARMAAVRRDLPALLDLLRVSLEAGASLPEGLAGVARRSRSPLARLWGGVAAELALGVPLRTALAEHRRELPLEEVRGFTAALERAARHGAPLSDTLAGQARSVRLARRRTIQEDAARAAPKMQLVVALLLVPSVMLLVAAALVSALAGEGAQGLLGAF